MRRYAVGLVWLAASLGGCTTAEDATQVIVIVDADPGVKSRTVELQLKVETWDGTAAGEAVFEEPEVQVASWPLRMALAPRGGEAERRYLVTAAAVDSVGDRVALARFASSYVAGEKRYYLLRLELCPGAELAMCTAVQTCRAGQCSSDVEVDPEDLPRTPPSLGGTRCARHEDCSDGAFCNGAEACDPEATDADDRGCVPGSAPCLEGQSCEEVGQVCVTDCSLNPDADRDGHDALECGGDDCDDSDADVNPGEAEVCDGDGVDEDCDPSSLGRRDRDLDGFFDAACCDRVAGELQCGDDCNDEALAISPDASEVCDEVDNDCDGRVDWNLGCFRFEETLTVPGAGQAIAAHPDGDLVVAGYHATGSGTTGTGTSLWVGKYTASGEYVWSDEYDAGYTGYVYFTSNEARSVATSVDGDVAVTGRVCSGGTEDSCDIFVRRYASTGVPRFTDTYNGGNLLEARDEGYGIAFAPDGRLVVAGTSSTQPAGPMFSSDVWVRSFPATEAMPEWTERITGPSATSLDGARAVVVDADGNAVVAGYYQEYNVTTLRLWKLSPTGQVAWSRQQSGIEDDVRLGLDGSGAIYVAATQPTGDDARVTWVRKYDASGGVLWTKTYDFTGVVGFAVDADGNFFFARNTYQTNEGWRLWLRKYDATGEPAWTNPVTHVASTLDLYVNAISTTPTGDVLVTGRDGDTIWFGKFGP